MSSLALRKNQLLGMLCWNHLREFQSWSGKQCVTWAILELSQAFCLSLLSAEAADLRPHPWHRESLFPSSDLVCVKLCDMDTDVTSPIVMPSDGNKRLSEINH